jgi:hypothetical protein
LIVVVVTVEVFAAVVFVLVAVVAFVVDKVVVIVVLVVLVLLELVVFEVVVTVVLVLLVVVDVVVFVVDVLVVVVMLVVVVDVVFVVVGEKNVLVVAVVLAGVVVLLSLYSEAMLIYVRTSNIDPLVMFDVLTSKYGTKQNTITSVSNATAAMRPSVLPLKRRIALTERFLLPKASRSKLCWRLPVVTFQSNNLSSA